MDMGRSQAQNSFSDEEIATRLTAETKQLVITPLSNVVQIEGSSDAQIVAQHTSGPALANTSTDVEETSPETPTSPSSSDHRTGGHILAITLTSVVLLAAAGALYFLTMPR